MSSSLTYPAFPPLDTEALPDTRDALHAHAQVLGAWTSSCRDRRKHWWHASLRPSLNGLTTGVVFVESTSFDIELNFRESLLLVRTHGGESLTIALHGQAASESSAQIGQFLQTASVSKRMVQSVCEQLSDTGKSSYPGYSPTAANAMGGALASVTAVMESFRAGIREETSPIQIWPHHFDLSMIWLPGDRIDGKDPDDEENTDKQMGFGFVFGDEGIPEPYVYITAYPAQDAFAALDLPDGTVWTSDGFTGAVVTYQSLLSQSDPGAYVLKLCQTLLAAGRIYLIDHSNNKQ